MKRNDNLSNIISEEIKMITAGRGPEAVEGEWNFDEYSIIRSVMALKNMVDSEAGKYGNVGIGGEYSDLLDVLSDRIDHFIRENGLNGYYRLLSGK